MTAGIRFLLLVTHLFIFSLLSVKVVVAHSLDISQTNIFIPEKSQLVTKPGMIQELPFEIVLPWTEAGYIVEKETRQASPSVSLLPSYLPVYQQYLDNHILLINQDSPCKLQTMDIPTKTQEEIMLGKGLIIRGSFKCSSPLKKLLLNNRILVDDVPLQTNVVTFYYQSYSSILHGSLLTPQSQDVFLDVGSIDFDQLPSSNVASSPAFPIFKPTPKDNLLSKITSQLIDIDRQPLITILGIMFLLGFLHTLEAGHSKTVMTTMLVQQKARWKQGVQYAAVFTATHIADILLIGVIFLITNSFIDLYQRLPYLQLFSLYALSSVALYMTLAHLNQLYKKYFLKISIIDHEHHEHHHPVPVSFKQQLLVGFISGLAPCLFGWSIFMLVLATGKIWLVFPVIVVFAAGIFTALTIIAWLVTKSGEAIMHRFSWLIDIVPLFSSIVLLAFALLQLF